MSGRPNILHIVTDQQRFDTIAALGNPLIRTPHLDWLVKTGTAFSRAYSPSPECVPARAAMITGRYPGTNGCFSNQESMPPNDTPTLMSRLSAAGYRTHGIGKCHFTPDASALRGFQSRQTQEELPISREKDNYSSWLADRGYSRVIEPHGVRSEMYYVPQVSVLPEDAHPSRWIADQAIDFLGKAKSSKPWYLYTSFVHPHPPFCPPSPWHKLYRPRAMPLPAALDAGDDLKFFVNRKQNRLKYRDRGFDLNLVRCIRAYYYSCISFVDAQLGRIFQQLENLGQRDNTLIVFTSDHGEYLGDYQCFGKRGMHDVSARIPLLVRWPGARNAGSTCARPVSLIDLAPTFLAAAGIDYRDFGLEGENLAAILANDSSREFVCSQYHRGNQGLYMVVGPRYKYVYSAADACDYFFDAVADPTETRNLATLSGSLPVLKKMRAACINWVRQTQPAEVEGDSWKTYPPLELPADPDEGTILQDPSWWQAETAPWSN